MKKLALLALPMCLVFLLFLGVEDGFSRGGRGGGGGGGGGFGGGGYSGARRRRRSIMVELLHRSPSMSSPFLGSRSSASQLKADAIRQCCLSAAASLDFR